MVVPGGLDHRNERWVLPYLAWLVERLARRHEVHAYAIHRRLERRATYRFMGATVHALGGPFPELRGVLGIVSEHRRRRFDVVHALWAHWPGTVAAIAGRLIRRPVLLHLAGGELVGFPDIGYGARIGWRGRTGVRLALRGASRITVASGEMRELAGRLGFEAIEVPLGVDLTRWPARAPRPRDVTRPARLLHVGTLNRVKDHATLLAAAARLHTGGLVFHLDVVGRDTLGGEVQALARSLGIEEYVTFRGELPHRELRPLMADADVLLVSSRHEAGPMVLLEAAATGVPTVGTAVGHVRDWAPEAAVAVPVRDAVALACETRALLEDEPRRLRIAWAAQQRAVARDAEWTAAAFDRQYAEMIAAAAERRRTS